MQNCYFVKKPNKKGYFALRAGRAILARPYLGRYTYMMMKISGLLLSIFFVSFTLSAHGESKYYSIAKKNLSAVKIKDGISLSEARIVGDFFFHYYEGVGCGVPGNISETDTHWVVQTHIGYAGKLGKPFLISKTTGEIAWKGEVCVSNRMEMAVKDNGVSKCGLADW